MQNEPERSIHPLTSFKWIDTFVPFRTLWAWTSHVRRTNDPPPNITAWCPRSDSGHSSRCSDRGDHSATGPRVPESTPASDSEATYTGNEAVECLADLYERRMV